MQHSALHARPSGQIQAHEAIASCCHAAAAQSCPPLGAAAPAHNLQLDDLAIQLHSANFLQQRRISRPAVEQGTGPSRLLPPCSASNHPLGARRHARRPARTHKVHTNGGDVALCVCVVLRRAMQDGQVKQRPANREQQTAEGSGLAARARRPPAPGALSSPQTAAAGTTCRRPSLRSVGAAPGGRRRARSGPKSQRSRPGPARTALAAFHLEQEVILRLVRHTAWGGAARSSGTQLLQRGLREPLGAGAGRAERLGRAARQRLGVECSGRAAGGCRKAARAACIPLVALDDLCPF